MPYIGNPPAERFTSFAYQDLTGGSGTSFTLDNAVGNPQEIEVFVNNVRQEPGVAYTVSGTALTMTGSIATTDDFYVVFQGKAIQTATHPSDRALTATDGTFTGDLTVDTNTLVVDAANNRVGVGTTTVDSALHIEQNASGVTETSGSTLKVHNTNSSGRSKITVHNSPETASGSIYYDTDSGMLALQGDTGAGVVFHTNGNNERGRWLVGGGLTFNGDTATANALDDYEEGTWTPTDNSGAGLSFTNGDGYYTKVGRQVFAAFRLTYPSTSDTNMASIAGLPFTAGNITDAMFGGSSTYHQDSGIGQPFSFLVADNGSFLAIFYDGSSQRGNNNFSGKPLRGFVIYNV